MKPCSPSSICCTGALSCAFLICLLELYCCWHPLVTEDFSGFSYIEAIPGAGSCLPALCLDWPTVHKCKDFVQISARWWKTFRCLGGRAALGVAERSVQGNRLHLCEARSFSTSFMSQTHGGNFEKQQFWFFSRPASGVQLSASFSC